MDTTGAAATSGMDLRCINPWEVAILRKEAGLYVAHGIQLEGGATVVDVGANIGVFSAYVQELLGGEVSVLHSNRCRQFSPCLSRTQENSSVDG
jgi:hypothetical protein